MTKTPPRVEPPQLVTDVDGLITIRYMGRTHGPFANRYHATTHAAVYGIPLPPLPPPPNLLQRACQRARAWFAESDDPTVNLWGSP